MTNLATADDAIPTSSPQPRATGKREVAPPLSTRARTSKSEVVAKLLARPKGATVDDMITATGWQPHSVRAFLSGLRKRGHVLIRKERKDGRCAYRIGEVPTPPSESEGSTASATEA